jgi:hypothetical protein
VSVILVGKWATSSTTPLNIKSSKSSKGNSKGGKGNAVTPTLPPVSTDPPKVTMLMAYARRGDAVRFYTHPPPHRPLHSTCH